MLDAHDKFLQYTLEDWVSYEKKHAELIYSFFLVILFN